MALGLAACGSVPDPRAEQASLLDANDAPAVAHVRTLTVRLRLDGDLQQTPGHTQRAERRVAAASAWLDRAFGLRLQVTAVEGWETGGLSEAEALLSRLEAQTPDPTEDLVIAFTGAPPPRRPVRADLAWSRYTGRHLLLRTLTEQFERDPEGQHDTETLLLIHALGRILGALPACSPELMSPYPAIIRTPGDARFAPENRALIAAHLTDATHREGPRVSRELATQALAATARPGRLNCQTTPLSQRRALWGRVERQVLGAPRGERPPEPVEPDLPAVTRALALRAAGDPAAALVVCAPLADARPESPATRCAGLAAADLKESELATRYLRAHLAHQPDDEEAVLSLAREVGRSGDDAAARALLAGYVETHPEHLRARINLGVAYARLGDLALARAAWEAVLAKAPENADAQDLLSHLPPR